MEINILMIKLAERKTICNCWKSANVNHTHARQQLCKLKLNMNKYSRSYMNVRASSMFVPAENWQNRNETGKNKNERKKKIATQKQEKLQTFIRYKLMQAAPR